MDRWEGRVISLICFVGMIGVSFWGGYELTNTISGAAFIVVMGICFGIVIKFISNVLNIRFDKLMLIITVVLVGIQLSVIGFLLLLLL